MIFSGKGSWPHLSLESTDELTPVPIVGAEAIDLLNTGEKLFIFRNPRSLRSHSRSSQEEEEELSEHQEDSVGLGHELAQGKFLESKDTKDLFLLPICVCACFMYNCLVSVYEGTDTSLTLPLSHHDFQGLSLIWSHEFPRWPTPFSITRGHEETGDYPMNPHCFQNQLMEGIWGDPPPAQFTSPKHLTEVCGLCVKARLSVLTLCLLHILFFIKGTFD